VEVPAAPEPATAPGAKSRGQETHLPTPLATPTPEQPALPEQPVLPGVAGNIAPHRNQVYANLDKSNIIPGSRTRRGAHAVAISQNSDLLGYYSAFSTAIKAETTKPPHKSTLPKPPKSWKHMLKHLYTDQFRKAAEKEYRDLQSKETFKYSDISNLQGKKPLLLMWVFTYKFDQDRYLLKYKARLVARGDL
jgi:hypothetical protein